MELLFHTSVSIFSCHGNELSISDYGSPLSIRSIEVRRVISKRYRPLILTGISLFSPINVLNVNKPIFLILVKKEKF